MSSCTKIDFCSQMTKFNSWYGSHAYVYSEIKIQVKFTFLKYMYMYIQLVWKINNHYLKSCGWIIPSNRCSSYATLLPIPKAPPPPTYYFQQLVLFCTNYQCHIDLQNENFLFCKLYDCRRNHPYNRSTFWQPPMHPLHSLWNKRAFHTENQVYYIYFKLENYFEMSI